MKQLRTVILGIFLAGFACPALSEDLAIEVYKSPYCGCCDDWITHLEDNGFTVTSHTRDDMADIKARLGVSPELQSCHTGVIDGYFVEGHVPASDIKRMLSEKPEIKGLTVPGMPAGENVPGMETRPGNATFDVLAVDEDGVETFTHYE
ncbi:MAG: DUF411 domain-containing protein [Halioglobus sp.]